MLLSRLTGKNVKSFDVKQQFCEGLCRWLNMRTVSEADPSVVSVSRRLQEDGTSVENGRGCRRSSRGNVIQRYFVCGNDGHPL